MNQVLGILTFALYPALAMLAGGAYALVRPPGAGARSAIQHFTAGVIFAALATELLPDLMHRRMPFVTLAGFSLGVLVMLGIKHLAEKVGQKGVSQTKQPISLLFTLVVDIALDGLLIGLGFAAGQKQGMLLTVALSLEVLFLGLSCSTALVAAGATRTKIILALLGLTICLLLGAVAGAAMLTTASAIMIDAVLAFGVAGLLYLVTEELLVEAHDTPETALQTAMFFVGFIVLLVIEMTM
jgi:ZIP family zinc transporter